MLRRGTTIAGGTVTDWPDYRERSLMLDVGREFMPVDMLHDQIRRMAQLELNLLHPTLFVDGIRLTPQQNVSSLGSGLYVWCDDPTVQTPAHIAASITMPLRVIAQKAWGPAKSGSYPEFAALSDAIAEPVP